LRIRIQCLFDRWIRDPGWVKNQDAYLYGTNNPDHISENLETIFWAKMLNFFDADPESGTEKFVSGINIPDPHTGICRVPLDRSLAICGLGLARCRCCPAGLAACPQNQDHEIKISGNAINQSEQGSNFKPLKFSHAILMH
jgi:hypothetical protein